MYQNNQQPHSSGGNYQQHHQASSGHSSFGAAPLRHPTSYPRSSSVSSALGYQQVPSPDFDNPNMQPRSAYYSSDIQRQYTSSPQTPGAPIPPYQVPGQRSAGDSANYATGHHELNGTSAFRRTEQSIHSGPSRARTMSLSYAQPGISARSPSTEYGQQKYSHDPRFPSQQQHPYPPPISYRSGAASPPPLSGHSSSRPVPGRMNSSPLSHTEAHSRQSPLTSQLPPPPIHRRDRSASTSSQSYQSRAVTIEAAAGHVTNSSATQPRPHVCEMCGLAFVRGHDLKRHKDTHTNSKPHVCDCGKSFSRKDALKRHVYLKSCRGEKMGSGYATSEE